MKINTSLLIAALSLLAVSGLMAKQQSKKDEVPGVAAQPAEFFYTGKPYDADLSAYTFRFRNYDPKTSRWSSVDPSGFPDGANNFVYIRNIPTIWVDDNGLSGTLAIYSSSEGTSSLSTSGHSWIEYTPDGGTTTTYGTWGNNPGGLGNGLHTNLETNITGVEGVTVHLTDAGESTLMGVINRYASMGESAWSLLSPCSSFAADAWNTTTGIYLSPGFPSTPTGLLKSIRNYAE